jgi:hypothetical protein
MKMRALLACLLAGLTVATPVAGAAEEAVSAAAITTNGNGHATDVGTWFITYNGKDNTGRHMWEENFNKGFPIMYRPLDHRGNFDRPESSDPALSDFYLSKMAAAGIDFVLFDLTNGGFPGTPYETHNDYIVRNAAITAQRIDAWNDTHSWKIKYAMAIGTHDGTCKADDRGLCAEKQARSVYENFVSHPDYGGSDYYQVDGKPLLVLYSFNVADPLRQWNDYRGDKSFGNRFTVRGANTSAAGEYGWQATNGPQIHPEVEVVSPGWNNHNGGCPCYTREGGSRYERDWRTVLTNPRPRIVMIQSFNDYNEDSAVWTADTSRVDPAKEEPWIGVDGVARPAQYWDATVANIAALRGASPQDRARGATALASSTYPALPTRNLTDGDATTVHSTATGNKNDHEEWVEIRLPAITTFNRVTLVNRPDGPYGFPRDFQIQVWDGSSWITRVTKQNHAQPAAGTAVSFAWDGRDTTSRVRLLATSLGSDNHGDRLVQLAGFEVAWQSVPVPHLAVGAAVTASSSYAPLPPANLTDGTRSTVYSSAPGSTIDHTETVEIKLGAQRAFSQVRLVNRSDGPYGFPRDFQIQVWDGSRWLTRVTRTGFASPGAGGVATFTWDGTDWTDRVRLVATSLGTDDRGHRVLQLGEFELG